MGKIKKLKRRKIKKKNNYLIVIIVFVLFFLSTGYAFLSTSLSLKGSTKISKNTWSVFFENVQKVSTNLPSDAFTYSFANTATSATFNVHLQKPGDYIDYTVDVKNAGTIDAMINSVQIPNLSQDQKKYIDFSITYIDGKVISTKDLLKAGSKERIKVHIKYKEGLDSSLYPTDLKSSSLSLKIDYVQSDSTANKVEHYICKKATKLHTEVCNQTSGNIYYYCDKFAYSKGATVTYGSLRSGSNLKSGDAFDCDVNGDGVYDSATERFYYVTGLNTDSNYAVLIYYSNVSGGKPTNTINYYYNEPSYSGDGIMFGPNTAKLQLPKTNQWSNVSLTNTTRNILDDKGAIKYSNFSYEGFAARLLTYQEVVTACGGNTETYGYLENCRYLTENTQYTNSSYTSGYWLETQNSHNDGTSGAYQQAFAVGGSFGSFYGNLSTTPAGTNSKIGSVNLSKYYGVRPVIEVPKVNLN